MYLLRIRHLWYNRLLLTAGTNRGICNDPDIRVDLRIEYDTVTKILQNKLHYNISTTNSF